MTEIMIDIETLAVPEDLPPGRLVEVVQIAAIKTGLNGIEDTINLFPAQDNGLCSASTVTFWLQQLNTPGRHPQWMHHRTSAESPETLPSMKTCLQSLTRFIGTSGATIWSKGSFDLQILLDHYTAHQLLCPWRYYQQRDLRTLMKECGISRPYTDTQHDALADAQDQLQRLLECRECITRRLAV